MILPVEEEMKLTDEEFEELMKNFDEELDKYTRDMIEKYVAFYLARGYHLSSLFQNKLDINIKTAILLLESLKNRLYDIEKIKKILEDNYGLKITDDDRTLIEEI